MRKRDGFTLIEVLVVVGIIALLVAILVPSLMRAKAQARLTVCGSNLHQIGVAMTAYMPSNRDRMPTVSAMPSAETPPVYLADVLRRYLPSGRNSQTTALPPGVYPLVGTGGAYECPDDRPGNNERPEPPVGLGRNVTYYQSEKMSYEFRTRLCGHTPLEFPQYAGGSGWRRRHNASMKLASNSIWIVRDYWNFHGQEKAYTGPDDQRDPNQGSIFVASPFPARRYVYIDGHVGDYEN
jgi:prepilin-type N-terminal cleavage/methylation domain-containing protein